jgi:uncharacterized YccA/Bax inhibitor family protein
MRTGNPTLSDKAFAGFGHQYVEANQTMTLQGTVNKTGILLLLLFITAAWVWNMAYTDDTANIQLWMFGGLIGGLIMAIVTMVKPNFAPITAPLYAMLEGLALGAISIFFEMRYPGIVVQAIGLTMGILLALLMAYKSGLIKATENFKLGVVAATGGIFLVYMFSFVLGFFGINMPYIHQSGMIGIGFSLFVVVIASLNLVLDFDFIESGAENGAPKYMEWYGAFGLVVTLVWLYIEILRLLSKLNRN